MKKLWNIVNGFKVKNTTKNEIYIMICMLSNLLFGGILWGIIGRFIMSGVVDLVCFMGYPAVFIGLYGGLFYLFNHEFA